MYAPTQIIDTERRLVEREPARRLQVERVRSGAVIAANERDRVVKRKRRLARAMAGRPALASEVGPPRVPAQIDDIALERIIGPSDLINVSYLRLALRACRAVGRIRMLTSGGVSRGHGTGFLVSPRVLLTNHHVLSDAQWAQLSEVDFDYEIGIDGVLHPWRTFRFDPPALFVTDRRLDYTLVALDSNPAETVDYGYLPLIEEQGKVLIGEFLNIIQHPSGAPKQLAMRRNQLVDILPDFLHYETDTLPGSSGSPVLNDQWEVVALHHSGAPRRDKEGRVLAIDGTVWNESMGEHRIDWIANEGVRVSRIVEDLKGRALAGEAQSLRDEVLAAKSAPTASERLLETSSGTRAAQPFQLPVRLTIEPIATQTALAAVVAGPTAGPPALPLDLEVAQERALAELEEARAREYYDVAADKKSRAEYYATIKLRANRKANFEALHRLVAETHLRPVPYKPSLHLYPWVDLQPERDVQSIYSSRRFDPKQMIEADFAVEAAERTWAEALRTSGASETIVAAALLEAAAPYNCEHVVPQSWFGKRDPMRGDLHHLFTCEWGCNSFRGNTPYYDFKDFAEADRNECGRRLDVRFEPEAGKGVVARATLYFLLRYPGDIGGAREMPADRLETLLAWHRDDPVNLYERHRNAAVFERQGNRNPLIDNPAWADRVDFAPGWG